MKTLLLFASLALIATTSCKKKPLEPEVITKEVLVHDTVHSTTTVTVTIHDTVHVNTTPLPLNGIWKCYKVENGSSTALHNDWTFTFGNSQITQVLGTSGTFNYPITYYSGSVDIFYTSTPTTYFITVLNNGTEYKLTKSDQSQSWYLKK